MQRLTLLLVALVPCLHAESNSPFLEMASSVLQNLNNGEGGEGLGALGSIVGSLMQGQGGPAEALSQNGDNGLGAIGSILGSLLQNQNGGDPSSSGDNGLGALGTIVGALMQNSNGGNDDLLSRGNDNGLGAMGTILGSLMQSQNGESSGGDVLSSLSSLISGKDGKIDPTLVTSMIDMFAQQYTNTEPSANRQKRDTNDNQIDVDSVVNVATKLLGKGNTKNFLPLIMSTINSFMGEDARRVEEKHAGHASFLPPIMEKIHLYWDLFISSPIGQLLYQKLGMKEIMDVFTGPDGKLAYDTMMEKFENQSFRRHWIKVAARYLTELIVHLAKPTTQQKVLNSFQFFLNTVLEKKGVPKAVHFDAQRPTRSITTLVNFSLKNYLDIDTDVSMYVKPAIEYIKQTLKIAEMHTKSLKNPSDYDVLTNRITDTLNLEVIEPVLRVYRAYKHSVKAPHCQEHLMCLVNKHHDHDQQGLPGFKQGLTKLSSFAASAALSFQNGKGFWDLYNAIQNDVNCEAAYPADCASFHEHELKVTTEVYHTEL